jgi:hypothetical protein
MKILVSSFLLLGVLISCGEANEKKNDQNTSQDKPQTAEASTLPSADYSSLLVNYECDMTPAEAAKVLNIPETDVSLAKYQQPGGCSFSVKGFGENGLGDDTAIVWFLEELGKAQVSKEIKSYLDDQANNESVMEMAIIDKVNKEIKDNLGDQANNENVLGMGIDLSETGDSYIARQAVRGTVVIMNANYDHWLVLSYSPKHLYKSRTQEQHDTLGEKMIGLANYLLKKHKK